MMYPNPAANQVTLELRLTDDAVASVSILDVAGKVLFENELGNLPEGSHRVHLDATPLAEGVYLCVVRTHDEVLTERLVISR
jgi:hypothetical protein